MTTASRKILSSALAVVGVGLLCAALAVPFFRKEVMNPREPRLPEGVDFEGEILWDRPLPASPQGVLVLASGINDRTGALVRMDSWREFARTRNLALAEASFSSPTTTAQCWERGYWHPALGSGALLEEALRREFGGPTNCPPLFHFGFSMGGNFVYEFQQMTQYPVAAWTVLGRSILASVDNSRTVAPALLLCGEKETGIQRSHEEYLQDIRGRGQDAQLQVIPNAGHQMDERAFDAARVFFQRILREARGQQVPPVGGRN